MNITFQGKPAVAVCLDDIQTSLTTTTTTIKTAFNDNKMGKHNVTNNFVPINSTNPFIRNESNSQF